DPAKMVSAVFGGIMSILVLLMVLHGPIATNILDVYAAALAALSMGLRLSRTALALIAGVVGYLATIYFVFQPSFAQAFDNWMISLLLWMSPWAGIVLTDFFIVRKGRIDVAELYKEPARSAYGDINWGAIVAFVVGLVAGWSVEDGLVPALKGPISIKLLGGADLSWLVGIVVAGGVYLLLGQRAVHAPVQKPAGNPRLVIGTAPSPKILPEDIGRPAMVEKVAEGVRAAMREAGIDKAADVHYVQTKTALLTIEAVRDAARRGHTVACEVHD